VGIGFFKLELTDRASFLIVLGDFGREFSSKLHKIRIELVYASGMLSVKFYAAIYRIASGLHILIDQYALV
jgi:hypothetical protein